MSEVYCDYCHLSCRDNDSLHFVKGENGCICTSCVETIVAVLFGEGKIKADDLLPDKVKRQIMAEGIREAADNLTYPAWMPTGEKFASHEQMLNYANKLEAE